MTYQLKARRDVVSHIITANSRQSNFLLNVGPGKDGSIHPDSVKRLKEIGEMWIPINEILSSETKEQKQ